MNTFHAATTLTPTALEELLRGRISRGDVARITREMWPEGSGQGNPFRSGDASTVFESIWNIEERRDGELLVRDSDVRAYVRWLTEPTSLEGAREVACATRTAERLAGSLGLAGVRFWFDGLGWYLEVQTRSPRSDRQFIILGPLEFETGRRVSTIRTTLPDRADLRDDILTTLGLEPDELVLGEDPDASPA